jgi:drug/metabolite transporter (DMT)-like permease
LLSSLPLLWAPEQLAPMMEMGGKHWLILLGIGVTLSVITLTVQFGLSHTPANQAIVIFLFELVVAAISSYFLANEMMNIQEWLGGAMIVIASFYSGIIEKKQNDK